jgi:uncharacterized protein YkwD
MQAKNPRPRRISVAASVGVALMVGGVVAPTASAAAQPASPTVSHPARAPYNTVAPSVPALTLINQERAKAGCPALIGRLSLYRAAYYHSRDMASRKVMSHIGSNGSRADQRMQRWGYNPRAWAENVAYGYSTPERVVAAWMASPGHRANILNCTYKDGAVASSGSYWTAVFATR